jgi:hydrogenase maturation protein HypF
VITGIEVQPARVEGLHGFVIRETGARPVARISPDLPVCAECLGELFDPSNRRFWYPYICCTNCGPRYSIALALPYDRPNTTMARWPLDAACAGEYADPADRRFHAQPLACPACGPGYQLRRADATTFGSEPSIRAAAERLRDGRIVAVKGIGGYQLACDARNGAAVDALRQRKFRKDKPFALMVPDVAAARRLIDLSPEAEGILTSPARPVVVGAGRVSLPGVAPDCSELGVMLPYAPLHHLLFAAGAPDVLVMTSANRSSEPIAYEDDDALVRLGGIADAFLVGERPIARRVEDSVVRETACGPIVLRRSRGYAPTVVAQLPTKMPIVAVGADLKNAIALVVDGQAIVSQHFGDLADVAARQAFDATIADLMAMYGLSWAEVTIAHDCHPEYASTLAARSHRAAAWVGVQHHRAHVASVLAERAEFDRGVVGVSCDGTGYGDDGSIWGGEIFVGSVSGGFERVAHLRPVMPCGGDAAARAPVQAAAGFLADLEPLPDLLAAPFNFPRRYADVRRLQRHGVRLFKSSSAGRLFDAAILGFVGDVTFEGQAAMWLEHLAAAEAPRQAYPFPFDGVELDYRPLLAAVMSARLRGDREPAIARAFQLGIATRLCRAISEIAERAGTNVVVLSGGVFQNALLLHDVRALLADRIEIWTNCEVPPNDGGISLGQAAVAACAPGSRS